MATQYDRRGYRDECEEVRIAKGLGHPAMKLHRDYARPEWWTLRFGGSCDYRSSRGAVGRWAFMLQDSRYRTLKIDSGPATAEVVTINRSGWQGVLNGIRATVAIANESIDKPFGLAIESDNTLLTRMLSGYVAGYVIELKAIRDECRDLLAGLGVPWSSRWITREENEFCNSLARLGAN